MSRNDIDDNRLPRFLKESTNQLNTINEKLFFFWRLSLESYSEVGLITHMINNKLHKMNSAIDDSCKIISECRISDNDTESIHEILAELKELPELIMPIISSMEIHDEIEELIGSIVYTIKTTMERMDKIVSDKNSVESFNTIKLLKEVTDLITVQCNKIYEMMSKFVHELPKMFRLISERLTPPLSFEAMLEGGVEKSRVATINEHIAHIIVSANGGPPELIAKLKSAHEIVELLEKEVPENNNLVNLAIVATMKLDQPFTEILFLCNSLEKLSKTSEGLLVELYKGNINDLDCSSTLSEIEGLFAVA